LIVDHRIYELPSARPRDFPVLHEKEGLPVQKKHLGNLVGFFTTEVGNVNEIVHIWGYEDLADRTGRRALRWQPIPHGGPICRRAENI